MTIKVNVMKKAIYCSTVLGRLTWIVVYGLIAIPVMIVALIIQVVVTGGFLPKEYYSEKINV